MNELEVVLSDMHRLRRAVLELNKGNKNKLISDRVEVAVMLADTAHTLDEITAACSELRWLFKFFMHREEPDEIPDPAQSRRPTSVRHSVETGDRGGNLDNPNVGSPSVSVPDVEPGRSDGHVAPQLPVNDEYRDSSRVARTLPKRKAHKARTRSLRRASESDGSSS